MLANDDMRKGFFMAHDAANYEHIKLESKEIDARLKNGPELVWANFVIPYPPGFPDHGARAGYQFGNHHVHAKARCEGDSRVPRHFGIEIAKARWP
jgi:hypothetical protein